MFWTPVTIHWDILACYLLWYATLCSICSGRCKLILFFAISASQCSRDFLWLLFFCIIAELCRILMSVLLWAAKRHHEWGTGPSSEGRRRLVLVWKCRKVRSCIQIQNLLFSFLCSSSPIHIWSFTNIAASCPLYAVSILNVHTAPLFWPQGKTSAHTVGTQWHTHECPSCFFEKFIWTYNNIIGWVAQCLPVLSLRSIHTWAN